MRLKDASVYFQVLLRVRLVSIVTKECDNIIGIGLAKIDLIIIIDGTPKRLIKTA